MEYFLEIDNDSMFCAQGYGKKILKITRMSQIEPMNHFVQSRYARNMRYVLNTFQGFSRQMLLLVLAVSVGFFSTDIRLLQTPFSALHILPAGLVHQE